MRSPFVTVESRNPCQEVLHRPGRWPRALLAPNTPVAMLDPDGSQWTAVGTAYLAVRMDYLDVRRVGSSQNSGLPANGNSAR